MTITLKALMLVSALVNLMSTHAPTIVLDQTCPLCQQKEEATLSTLQDLEKSLRQLRRSLAFTTQRAA